MDASCRVCGCTSARACPGGCIWAGPDLCSQCVDATPHLVLADQDLEDDGDDQVVACADCGEVAISRCEDCDRPHCLSCTGTCCAQALIKGGLTLG